MSYGGAMRLRSMGRKKPFMADGSVGVRKVSSLGCFLNWPSAADVSDGLPPAEHMLADRGYDADWYREALEDKGIPPCIPSRKNRKVPIPHDEARYRKRHKIDALLKDWRRVATRYDRCPKVFLSACALAAVAMFWL